MSDSTRALSGYTFGPTYRVPLRLLALTGLYMLSGRPRNLGREFARVAPAMPLAPVVHGTEHIPDRGPFIVVGNHYERPGLWMAWAALLCGRAVYERTGQGVSWIAITQWENYRIFGIPIPERLTRVIFTRFFDTFDFVGMPPHTSGAPARASGVRRAVQRVRQGGIIGIFPEGTIGPTPAMIPAQPGAGLFLQTLARGPVPVVPVGIYEHDARLTATFGPALRLDVGRETSRTEQDGAILNTVMRAVAALLPPVLRGAYADEAESSAG